VDKYLGEVHVACGFTKNAKLRTGAHPVIL